MPGRLYVLLDGKVGRDQPVRHLDRLGNLVELDEQGKSGFAVVERARGGRAEQVARSEEPLGLSGKETAHGLQDEDQDEGWWRDADSGGVAGR